jgi:Zn-dependent oligopeptidase
MYTRFQTEGILNPNVGKDLRQYVLEPCAVKEASQMLKDFLKRDYSSDAFYKSLHIA